MKHELKEGRFKSWDGTELFYRYYVPTGKIQNALFIVHGFGEYSKRYEDVISRLEDLPILVCTFDLRGHGESEGRRVFVNDFSEFIKDLDYFIDTTKYLFPQETENVYLYGHSMGGLVALAYVLEHRDKIKALIVSSPALGIKTYTPFAKRLVSFMAKFFPNYEIKNPIYPVFLTHDPKEVENYKTDRKIERKISVTLLREMLSYANKVSRRAGEVRIPLLVLVAGDERIIKADKVQKFYDQASSSDKKIFIFQDFYHELLKEKGKDQVIEKITDFLNEQIKL